MKILTLTVALLAGIVVMPRITLGIILINYNHPYIGTFAIIWGLLVGFIKLLK